jgi:hypothetical protein
MRSHGCSAQVLSQAFAWGCTHILSMTKSDQSHLARPFCPTGFKAEPPAIPRQVN